MSALQKPNVKWERASILSSNVSSKYNLTKLGDMSGHYFSSEDVSDFNHDDYIWSDASSYGSKNGNISHFDLNEEDLLDSYVTESTEEDENDLGYETVRLVDTVSWDLLMFDRMEAKPPKDA